MVDPIGGFRRAMTRYRLRLPQPSGRQGLVLKCVKVLAGFCGAARRAVRSELG
jgi:hypothetical protein